MDLLAERHGEPWSDTEEDRLLHEFLSDLGRLLHR